MLTFCKHCQYFSGSLCEFLRVLCIACGTCHLLDIVGIASCLNELKSKGEWFLHLCMLQKMCTTGIHAQVNVSEEVAHIFWPIILVVYNAFILESGEVLSSVSIPCTVLTNSFFPWNSFTFLPGHEAQQIKEVSYQKETTKTKTKRERKKKKREKYTQSCSDGRNVHITEESRKCGEIFLKLGNFIYLNILERVLEYYGFLVAWREEEFDLLSLKWVTCPIISVPFSPCHKSASLLHVLICNNLFPNRNMPNLVHYPWLTIFYCLWSLTILTLQLSLIPIKSPHAVLLS